MSGRLIAMAVLAAVALGPFATANAVSDKPPEDPAKLCQHSFENAAPARTSCNAVTFTRTGEDEFRVSGSCKLPDVPEYQVTYIVVTGSWQCGKLRNCGGILVGGSC